MAADVLRRLERLRISAPALRLYALVDGLQYEQRSGHPLQVAPGARPLFAGTPDAALAGAGPWLLDAELAPQELIAAVAALEAKAPAVSWIIAVADLEGLAALLQLRLDVRLPDGRSALLRFWDPRALAAIARELDERQRGEFFEPIVEWHLLVDGRRTHIGRHHAHAD